MKVWIAGGKGMLGTDLAATIAGRGHDIVVTDKELDICDGDAIAAFAAKEQPTHLVNCAAHTQVDLCESEEALATQINVDGPARLGELAKQTGMHAIQISTDYVFAGDANKPYVEDDPKGPASVYGKTKLAGEERFTAAMDGGGCIVRTSWLYGVHGKSFPATMLKLMAERESLSVVDDQRGRPTYTADFARALADVSERRLTGAWHFANAGDVTWHGFAVAIRDGAVARGFPMKATEIKAIPTSGYPTPAKRPAYSVLNTAKIERALGRAARPWQKALEQYLDVIKARGHA